MVKNPNSDRELVGATEFVATDPLLKKHQMLDPVTAMEREQELRSNHDFLNSWYSAFTFYRSEASFKKAKTSAPKKEVC